MTDALKVRALRAALDLMLSWALSNRGSTNEFVNCYTYAAGVIPPQIQNAKAVLEMTND